MKDAEKNAGPSHVISVKEVKNLQTQRPPNPFLKLPNNQEVKKGGEVTELQSQGPSNPFSKSSDKEEAKKVEEVTGVQYQRPNPFLKSTVK